MVLTDSILALRVGVSSLSVVLDSLSVEPSSELVRVLLSWVDFSLMTGLDSLLELLLPDLNTVIGRLSERVLSSSGYSHL